MSLEAHLELGWLIRLIRRLDSKSKNRLFCLAVRRVRGYDRPDHGVARLLLRSEAHLLAQHDVLLRARALHDRQGLQVLLLRKQVSALFIQKCLSIKVVLHAKTISDLGISILFFE